MYFIIPEKQYNLFMVLVYGLVLILLTIYSYGLIDPNLTLINHPLFEQFRNVMVPLGYYRRDDSVIFYFVLIILLFGFHFLFIKNYQRFIPTKLALLIGVILLVSYPFLSHDFFNYLFDAKIVTTYGQNPWFHRALDYGTDPWLRFMHWTHRTYPYGPVWLPLTLIPSFLGMGKLLLNFIFFKAIFVFFYIGTVYYLSKLNQKSAIFFATSPLVIIEGLINNHNDIIAVCFALIGVFYLVADRKDIPSVVGNIFGRFGENVWFARLHFLFSAGIKYTTLPVLFLQKETEHRLNKIAFVGVLATIIYASYTIEIQPWYFLNMLIFLPFFPNLIYRLNIFFAGLLFSYYPYIFLGGWDSPEKIALKHNIIISFFAINIIYLWMTRKSLSNQNENVIPHSL